MIFLVKNQLMITLNTWSILTELNTEAFQNGVHKCTKTDNKLILYINYLLFAFNFSLFIKIRSCCNFVTFQIYLNIKNLGKQFLKPQLFII